MTFAVHFLHGGVIGVFMGNKERGFNVATVGVFAFPVEYFFVQLDVVVVDGVVEGDGDHLGHILCGKVARNCGTILGTETIGKDTHRGVTWWRPVRIVIDVWKKWSRLGVAPTFLWWKVGRNAMGAAPAF